MCLNISKTSSSSSDQPEAEANNSANDIQIKQAIRTFRFKRDEYYHDPNYKPYSCDICMTSYDHEHTLIRHKKFHHLNPDTDFAQRFPNFAYLYTPYANPRYAKEDTPTVGKVEEVIVDNKCLKLVYININSLQSKNKQLRVQRGIIESKADIVILAETKIHEGTQEYKVPGYYQAANLVRRAGAGGLMVMVKSTIKIHKIVKKNVLDEIQVIQFEFSGQTIISVYRSPTVKLMSVPEREHHETIIGYLKTQIKKLKDKPFYLVGDFNLSDMVKCDFNPDPRVSGFEDDLPTKTYIRQIWSDFYFEYCLQQWVNEPTYPSHQSILDILMTPIGTNVELTVDKDLFSGNFDHYALVFKIDTNFETNETPRYRRVKTHANWMKFWEILRNENLHTHIYTKKTPKEMTEYLISKVRSAYDEAIPEVKIKPPKDCYLHRETKRFSRKATKLRKVCRRFKPGSPEYVDIKRKLKILDKCVDNMIKHDRAFHQVKKLGVSKNQKKNLYKHVQEANGKPSVNITGPVIDLNNILRTSDKDVANSFGDLMGEQLKPGDAPNVDWFKPYPKGVENTDRFYVSIEMIKKQIGLSRNDAAPGPDTIPMEAFSVASDILAEPISVLFNFILQTGDVPELFKISRVKMLFKKGEKSDMLNYRPLAMSSHLGKLWERVVNCHLMDFLEKYKKLSDRQYGFRRGRGTTENIIRLHEHVADRLEAEKCTIEIWNFDLRKAFDKLDHAKVLQLLRNCGVNGFLGLSIENWLTNRRQYVEVGNSKSGETLVGRSCVQGSVLGPTLWLLYIQSLTSKLDSMGVDFFAYADDLSIIHRIKTEQDKIDFEKILETLQDWSKEYDMEWSPMKTQRLVLGYQNCPEHTPLQIYFGGKEIKPLETSCTSLGIIIGNTCTFKEQRKKVCAAVKSLTGKMNQSFEGIASDILQMYYQIYVMPALIYCCQVWQSGDEAQLNPIEKAVSKFWELSPTGKPPADFIEPRILFILFDLNYTKKMKIGKSPLDFNEIFKTSKATGLGKNADDRIAAPSFRLEISRNIFSRRAGRYWNLIPKEIRDLEYGPFKKEAKSYVLNNSERFLNLGNKNKTRVKDLPEIVPYEPAPSKANSKDSIKGQLCVKEKIKKVSAPTVKRLFNEAKKCQTKPDKIKRPQSCDKKAKTNSKAKIS